ncbi:Fic family protein [Geotalea sp. SG265]|uniref:Fic family protein n=1 Tax=Geotalea sp. SG265 TaxID=2922867 RepID=UPI001FB01320|nr:Fic family protein [Geotalea sp. SG265]
MKKLPLFFLSDQQQSQQTVRAVKAGRARKIGPSLYTSNTLDAPEHIVRLHVWQIISLLLPGAVVSHRSAIEGSISPAGKVYLTAGYNRTIRLPGLDIVVLKGLGPVANMDNPLLDLFIASKERAFLENLSATKVRSGAESKVLSQLEIEERLSQILERQGEMELNRLRDKARQVAQELDMHAEFKRLDALIRILQGTKEGKLVSPRSVAHSVGDGYDASAVQRFAVLRAALADAVFPNRLTPSVASKSFYNTAFFDAYFTNFIEGNEFEVEEALKIIDSGVVPSDRPEDGYGILGTYKVVSRIDEMCIVPKSFDDFLDILTKRHAIIMEGRPDKRPGLFKEKPNVAGLTRFVEPPLVRGTLRQGYEFYRGLHHPFARALAMMFFVSEVHPFDDGNGRIARAMMNAELVAEGHTRVIVPTVFRGEYLSGLKRMTEQTDPTAFIRQLEYLQQFVSRIDFSEMDQSIKVLRHCNAFEKSFDDVRLRMP